MVGMGGTAVELYKDVALASAPLTRTGAVARRPGPRVGAAARLARRTAL